jgi:hypothetical protein
MDPTYFLSCNHNQTLCFGAEAVLENTKWSISHTMTTFTMVIFVPVIIQAMFADLLWEVFEASLATFFAGYWIFPMVTGEIETLANSLLVDPWMGLMGTLLGVVVIQVYGIPTFMPAWKPFAVNVVPTYAGYANTKPPSEELVQKRAAIWFHHQFYDRFACRFTDFNWLNVRYQIKYLLQLLLLEMQFFLMDVHFGLGGGRLLVDSRIIIFFFYPAMLLLFYWWNRPRDGVRITRYRGGSYVYPELPPAMVPVQNYLTYQGKEYLSTRQDRVLIEEIKANFEHVVLWNRISLSRYRVIYIAWGMTYITFLMPFILLAGSNIPTNIISTATCLVLAAIHILIYCVSPWLRKGRYLKSESGQRIRLLTQDGREKFVLDPESHTLFGLF